MMFEHEMYVYDLLSMMMVMTMTIVVAMALLLWCSATSVCEKTAAIIYLFVMRFFIVWNALI